jgi:hypothetical protein
MPSGLSFCKSCGSIWVAFFTKFIRVSRF